MTSAVSHPAQLTFWNLVREAVTAAAPAPASPKAMAVAVAAVGDASTGPAPVTLPDNLVNWLARMVLLYGLPLEYLVPHPAMLPAESIRFFTIDGNWLSRMIEGAASVGVGTSRDVLLNLSTLKNLDQQVLTRALSIRSGLRGVPPPNGSAGLLWSGFLLRSAVVPGWPGIEVQALDANGLPLSLLRMDRLTPGILLCIFSGVPATVNLMEPPETLHFGVLTIAGQQRAYLRGLGYGGQAAGIQFPPDPKTNQAPFAAVPPRVNATYPGVINVEQAVASLKPALDTLNALSPTKTFTSSEFAIQMVRGAGLQPFQPK